MEMKCSDVSQSGVMEGLEAVSQVRSDEGFRGCIKSGVMEGLEAVPQSGVMDGGFSHGG